MTETTAFELAIAELLADAAGGHPTVHHDAVASAGATRSTHFVSIDDVPAVVQLRHRTSELQMSSAATEVAVIRAAAEAGVPVAGPIAAGRVDALDADAIVTERRFGETIPRRVLRATPPGTAAARRLASDCGRALAHTHRVRGSALTTLDELPRHTAASYLEHLHHLLDELPSAQPALRYGLVALAERLPAEPTPTLVHGDFRNGNLLVADAGLDAVLDWELAHIGHPMEDVAWLCLRTWRFGEDDHPVGGFGDIDDLRTAYIEAGGEWDPNAIRWWTIARTIWWGAGLATQAAGFLRGDTDSLVHAASGRRVVELDYDLLQLLGDDHGP